MGKSVFVPFPAIPPAHSLHPRVPSLPRRGGRRTLRRRSSPLARSLIVSQGLMSIGWTRRVRRAVVYSEVHHPAEPRRLSGGKCITCIGQSAIPSCLLPQFRAVPSPVVRLYFDAPRLHSAFQFVQMGTWELPTNRPDRTRGRGRCEAKWSPTATQSFSQPAVGLLSPVSVNEIGP